ncbi:hypothetical protein ACFT5B_06815, partial [Luteimicrobium sp. NPDC057192]
RLHVERAGLLPTPRATRGVGDGDDVRPRREAVRRQPAAGAGAAADANPSAVTLLPTPSVADVEGGRKARSGARSDELLLNGIASEQRFGDYSAAVERWEAILGRPAPSPTEPTGKGGAERLSPRFVEWMMGLPDGWVTDTDTTRNEQLKALGNGVVPQQAEAALRHLLTVRAEALAVAA